MPVPFLNSPAGLRVRRAAATSPEHVAALDARIAEIEARLAALPQYLSLEIREEIADLEGQLRLHEARLVGNVERDCDTIRARIAELTRQGHAEAMAAGFARLDATLARLAQPLDPRYPPDVTDPDNSLSSPCQKSQARVMGAKPPGLDYDCWAEMRPILK